MSHVLYRGYIKGNLIARSPFLIQGMENIGDDEVNLIALKDSSGNPFIPGSSLAGALRNMYRESDKANILFGFADNNISKQSSIITYDCYIADESKIRYSVRDGIRLKESHKITDSKAKYDYEVIEAGAEFHFKLELIVRGDYSNHIEICKEFFKQVNSLIAEMKKGIYLGTKTNRGLGKFELEDPDIYEIYQEDAYHRYVNFNWNNSKFIDYYKAKIFDSGCANIHKRVQEFSVGIQFPATVLVRSYDNKEVKMLTANGKPVIPGTSWGGMFRHEALRILKEILKKLNGYAANADQIIEEMFGTKAEINGDIEHMDRRASKVSFSETEIEQYKPFKQTNVKIDRFTQAAVDSALFDESVVALGKTILSIRYQEEWMKELLCLVLKDLHNGFIAIGGQTSIGRGICKIEGEIPASTFNLIQFIESKGKAVIA